MIDFATASDEEIVEEVRSKNQELYTLIVERYQNKLLRYAGSIIKDKDKAADVVQNSFIKAFINLNGYDTAKSFSSWIYRIVHNEALNIAKKYQKEMFIMDDFDFQSDENIAENVERKEDIALIQTCLEQIPIIYSEPLALFYIEDKSYKEISDIVRIPLGTVATRINRAKLLMQKICHKR